MAAVHYRDKINYVIDIENQIFLLHRDEDLDKEAAEHVNNLSSPLLRSRYHFGMLISSSLTLDIGGSPTLFIMAVSFL